MKRKNLLLLALFVVACVAESVEVSETSSSSVDVTRHFEVEKTPHKPGKVKGSTPKHGKPSVVRAGTTKCYNTGSNTVNMRSTACGSTIVVAIPARTTVTQAGASQTLTCSLGYNTWHSVSYSGRNGWVASGLVSETECSSTPQPPTPSGSGWLTRAGTYTVENMDRRGRGYSSSAQTRSLSKFCLHTIEGVWPRHGDFEAGTNTLDARGYWPHFIVGYDRSGRLRIGQYLPMGNFARALSTGNSDGVVQVEIGGKAASPFTSNDAGLTDAVKQLYRAVSAATGIPLRVDARVRFVGSSGYGSGASQRLSQSVFWQVTGVVGHQHVYSNSHWDPGAINPNALL